MRIAHCQYESWCGEFERNLQRFAEGMERADRAGADLASFPECFLTGYPDREEPARAGALRLDSDEIMRVLDVTSGRAALAIVGFNELRGNDLFNTVLVAHRGHLLGAYSKCAAYMPFHRQGREFPVWDHAGVRFGVLICADGGYIEPARILAMKGAQLIVAPHFNCIQPGKLLRHFNKVRSDHTARAIENGVYFLRANNVVLDRAKSGQSKPDGVGYGDSYLMDPLGQIVAGSRRGQEDFFTAEVDPKLCGQERAWGMTKAAWSWREFGPLLAAAAEEAGR
jgi:predicted amidohydrolase